MSEIAKAIADQQAAVAESVRKMSNAQLREAYQKNPATGLIGQLIKQEIELRGMEPSKAHWTLTPGFVVLILTMILSGIAAWPVVHDWIWPVAKKDVQSEVAPMPKIEVAPSPTPSNAASLSPAQSSSSPASTPRSEPQP